MKKAILGIGFLFFSVLLVSCAATQTPQTIAKEAAIDSSAAQAIKDGYFVLEADELQPERGGATIQVPNTLNFIAVSSKAVTIQTSTNNAILGPNNVGGVTVDGIPGNIKITTDKQGNLNYSVAVSGLHSARIELTLYSNSNRATATVYPTFRSNSLTMNGTVVPAEQSRIFKGNTTP